MSRKQVDKKSERIVKKRNKADIIKANPKANTIKVRTQDKYGRKSARTYTLSTKHGLSPKRVGRRKRNSKKKKRL